MNISEAGFHIEINDPLNIYYNNSPARPQLTVKTPNETEFPTENYSVSYSNNNELGQALATVTASGNYTGSLTENFIIRPAPFCRNYSQKNRQRLHSSQLVGFARSKRI